MAQEPLVPPEPPKTWTDIHDLNETLRGLVIERRDFESKEDGTPYSVILVETKESVQYRVPCSRTDLRPLIEREDIAVGDEIAVTYRGKQGSRFIYTIATRRLQGEQGQLS